MICVYTFLYGTPDFINNIITKPNGLLSLSCVALLGIMGSAVAAIVFNKLIRISSPAFASSTTYAIPVFALMWSFIDGEALFFSQIIGFIMVLAGVILVTRAK